MLRFIRTLLAAPPVGRRPARRPPLLLERLELHDLPSGMSPVAAWFNSKGNEEVFAVTTSGGLYEQTEAANAGGYTTTGWHHIGDGVVSVVAMARSVDNTEVFAVTTSGGLYEQTEAANAGGYSTSGWNHIGDGVASVAATIGETSSNIPRLEVFAVTTAGGLYEQPEAANDGGYTSSGWNHIGDGVTSVAVGGTPTDAVDFSLPRVFAVTTSGALYEQKEFVGGYSASGWNHIGDGVASVAARYGVVGSNHRVEVFAVTTSGGLYEQAEAANGFSLNGWSHIGDGIASVTAANNSSGQMDAVELFAVTTSGGLYEQAEAANGGYGYYAFHHIGDGITSVAGGQSITNNTEVFAVTTSGALYEQTEAANGGGYGYYAFQHIGDGVA